MDIENILYIIVIIVWVIVGLVRKNKAKEGRPAQGMPPVGDSQTPDFSEMLEEIMGKKAAVPEKKAEPVPAPKKVPVFQKESTLEDGPVLESISVSDYAQRSLAKKEKKLPFQEKKHKPSVKQKLPEAKTEYIPGEEVREESFDLRKAVIYSEILKPKFSEEDLL